LPVVQCDPGELLARGAVTSKVGFLPSSLVIRLRGQEPLRPVLHPLNGTYLTTTDLPLRGTFSDNAERKHMFRGRSAYIVAAALGRRRCAKIRSKPMTDPVTLKLAEISEPAAALRSAILVLVSVSSSGRWE
jgi:hypothetical protein